jgi:tungstate transport system ATP-binding protein
MSDIPLYEIKNLIYSYGGTFSLDIPSFIIRKGASIGLMGPNGGGKSTFLRILSFLESPDNGEIFFEGKKIEKTSADLKRHVTILLQEPYLLKRSVFDNVSYGLKIRGETSGIKNKVHEALNWVGLNPDQFSHRRWYELSGGEAQRVALASRLVLRPRVLILDEPTASVDKESAILISDAIDIIRKEHDTSLVIASHDLIWLNSVTNEIEKMYDGKIVRFAKGNLISGIWHPEQNGLWKKTLPDGQQLIYSVKPPHDKATAVLDPSEILISLMAPQGMSAQNILKGVVTGMTIENNTGKVLVDMSISGMNLMSRITKKAAEDLRLIPGKEVWAVFKASSLHWH